MDRWLNSVHAGDALELLDELPAASVHAAVTDPPYGLAFMGRDWDDFEPAEYQQWCQGWGEKVKRVLKPGGHLLAFSGNRTHHRLFTGIEDAGFEIRDTVTWHYGSGFPKALDVSKAIDKAAGAERDTHGYREDTFSGDHERHARDNGEYPDQPIQPEPVTDAAERWDGWKTTLKPSTEFVVVARKLFDGTVAENMIKHGTAALNIDGCRVGTEELEYETTSNRGGLVDGDNSEKHPSSAKGRYPPNVLLDEEAARQMDSEVGETTEHDGTVWTNQTGAATADTCGECGDGVPVGSYDDSGGPSRYFYTSKASQAERTLDGKIENPHPTVKPNDLMEWLVKLVASEEQIVLDPFAGSGTTCKAAKNLNRRFIGIEKQAKWADVARVRCGLSLHDPSNVRPDDGQQGLEAYTDGGTL